MYINWIKVASLPNSKNVPEELEREAGLFMLEKPVRTIHGWNDVFVVSRIRNRFQDYETMVFAADDNGTVLNYERPVCTNVESSFFMGLGHVFSDWVQEKASWDLYEATVQEL